MGSNIPGADYQVFLSFRGPDTRQGFTDCLYHFLIDAGVRVFRDNEEIHPGEKITEILRAINNSIVCIPIFSKGYASSKWCLRELAVMVEKEKKIIPVFYDVTPDDVKLKTQLYRDALGGYEKENEKEKEQWEKALKEVVGISGWESSKGKEEKALKEVVKIKGWELRRAGYAELCKLIVKEVLANLKVKERVVTDRLVGIDEQVQIMLNYLDIQAHGVRYVGIYGIGGSGKTTLAKTLFNQLSARFEACSFLADVRESSKHGLEHLQRKLIHDLLPKYTGAISDTEDGIKVLRDTCRNKKVLIVLDDVDNKDQIKSLAGNSRWFFPGSRIIVTTRDISVLDFEQGQLEDLNLEKSRELRTLEMKEMNFEQALYLFSKHAFKMDYPPVDFLDLAKAVVSVIVRLPLTLEIIGSHLYGKQKEVWEENISMLERIPQENIHETLMITYEALDFRTRQIFLDIACLPTNINMTYATYMWKSCGFHPEVGMKRLTSRSIVKVMDENKLWMHDHFKDLGREIICMENLLDTGERSRLWDHEEAWSILNGREGTAKIEVLPPLSSNVPMQTVNLESDHFRNLRNLRFLHMERIDIIGDFKYQFAKLRWLSWHSCSLDFKAKNLCLKRLAVLDLSMSIINEHWEGWSEMKVGDSLAVLDLHFTTMSRVPNLSQYTNLERLDLRGSPLAELPDSMGCLKKLEHLSLAYCREIEELPDSFGDLKSLSFLDISNTCLRKLPDSIGNLEELRTLKMCRCWVQTLPQSIGTMKKLEEFDASYSNLEEIPAEIGRLSRLRRLNLTHTLIRLLPLTVCQLSSLEKLWLYRSGVLEELPRLPASLSTLWFVSYHIKTIPDLSNVSKLTTLVLDNTPKFYAVYPSAIVPPKNVKGLEHSARFGMIEFLKSHPTELEKCIMVRISGITSLPVELLGIVPQVSVLLLGCPGLPWIPQLPSSLLTLVLEQLGKDTKLPCLSNLENLSCLIFRNCSMGRDGLQSLGSGELEQLETLVIMEDSSLLDSLQIPRSLLMLELSNCICVQKLPDMSHLMSLQVMKVDRCNLLELPDLGGLLSLQVLFIHECRSLTSLGHGLPVSLNTLDLQACTCLTTLPYLFSLKNLRVLRIESCNELEAIPGLASLESLEELSLHQCISLKWLWLSVQVTWGMLRLENLKVMSLQNCGVVEISGLEALVSLRTLHISVCNSFMDLRTRLPASLEELLVDWCPHLVQFPDVSNLKNLTRLTISYCNSLREIPGLGELKVADMAVYLR